MSFTSRPSSRRLLTGAAAAVALVGLAVTVAVPAGAAAPPATRPLAATSSPAPAASTPTTPTVGADGQDLCATVGPVVPGTARCFAVARRPVRVAGVATPDTARPAVTSAPWSQALTPTRLRTMYGLGGGQPAVPGTTVALVTAYDGPNVESDLAAFRQYFGLPVCTTSSGCFRKVDQRGVTVPAGKTSTTAPRADDGWGAESSLDTQTVSAVCPTCRLLLVEADSAQIQDLGAAENVAVSLGARIVSNSYGTAEFTSTSSQQSQAQVDRTFYSHPGVAEFASTGDDGWLNYNAGTASPFASYSNFPATSANVLAVGGTTVTLGAGDVITAETAWDHGGSGCSLVTPRPDWQTAALAAAGVSLGAYDHCQTSAGGPGRADADVAAVADPTHGMAVYFTPASGASPGWMTVGGTSLSSPLLAGAQALAGLPGAAEVAAARPYLHGGAGLADVTAGTNVTTTDGASYCNSSRMCTATAGYDGPTGLGALRGLAALAAPASIGLDRPTASPGDPVTVTGSGFAAGAVTLSPAATGPVTADASGTFTATVTLGPAQVGGPLTVTATQGVAHATAALTVVPVVNLALPGAATTATAGGQVTLTGAGFAASETLSVTGGASTVPVTAGASGTLAATTVVLPRTAAASVPLTVSGSTSGPVTVTVPLTPPSVSATPSRGPAGASVTLSGAGFAAGETVTVTRGGAAAGATTAGAGGTFTTGVALAGSAGGLTLAATGTSGRTASTAVTVATPTLSGPTSPVAAGSQVVLSGTDFAPGETVTLKAGATTLGQVTAGTSGSWSTSVTVPTSAPVGPLTVTAAGAVSTVDPQLPLAVTAPVPVIQLGAATLVDGASTSLFLANFGASTAVQVTIAGNDALGSSTLATVTTGSDGSATVTVTVPAGLPAGSHVVSALTSGPASATTSLTTTLPAATLTVTAGGPAVPGSNVPVTGTGFQRGETVTLGVAGGPSVTATASATGSLPSTSVPLPQAAGQSLTVAATGALSGQRASQAVALTTPAAQAPAWANAGSTVTVTGTGFGAGEPVTVSGGAAAATALADASGAVSVPVTLATTTASSVALVLRSASGRTASATVLVPVVTASGPVAAGRTVTVTGINFPGGATVVLTLPAGLVTGPATVTATGSGTFTATLQVVAGSCQQTTAVTAAAGGRVASGAVVVAGGAVVPSGCDLASGQQITSPSGQYRLVMQPDGNLVQYGNGTWNWATFTTGTSRLAVQGDGNLVVYGPRGASWWTATDGAGAATLTLQDDGNLVLYAGGRVAWCTCTAARVDTLVAPSSLAAGWFLTSADGRFRLILQGDGNVVLYGPRGAKWSSRTDGTSGALQLAVQTDGNLVLYAAGSPRWATYTVGANAYLKVQNDGNLVLYDGAGRPLWYTNTVGI